MKKIVALILAFILLISFTACGGNYAEVNLNKPIAIPEDGIIEKSALEKIKNENAVATFTGESDNIKYEWKIFGSDLETTRDINLSVVLKKTDGGIKVKFSEAKDFGFPTLLSIYLNEKWSANSATAFFSNNKVYNVSVTGSKTTVLNVSVDKIVEKCEILPEVNSSDTVISDESVATENNTSADTETNRTDSAVIQDKGSASRDYSDGSSSKKDKYETDPVPEGKPLPVEPEEQEVDRKKAYTCTFSIECSTILNNLSNLDPDKRELVSVDGVILAPTKVTFYEGESVFDVLKRVCKENEIHLEYSWTPVYNSAYIEGIHNLYEFDCGELSGWMYCVNGWYPNYGCSRYQLVEGENVEWRFTCDLGKDVGCEWMG